MRVGVRRAGQESVRTGAALVVTAVIAYGALLGGSRMAILAAAGVVSLVVLLRNIERMSVLLLILAPLLLQPFAFGAGHTKIGSALALGAALLALAADVRKRTPKGFAPPARSVLFWVTLLWGWQLVQFGLFGGATPLSQVVQSAASVVFTTLSACLVLRDPVRRRWFCRGFIVLLAITCGSYALTLAGWLATGWGSLHIGTILMPNDGTLDVYAPFTPTGGFYGIFGATVPRFVGLLREPGLCQAFLIWAFFMAPRVGFSSRKLRGLLLLGVAGTLSTAGFGILAVVYVVGRVIGDANRTSRAPLVRQYLGVILLVGAAYVAVVAPVFGIKAKQSLNELSISDRWTNTEAGLQAIVHDPLGDPHIDTPNVGINTIAATTLYGVPGLVSGVLVFVAPVLRSRDKSKVLQTVFPLFLTGLVAQPILDAAAVFIIVVASTLPADDDEASFVSEQRHNPTVEAASGEQRALVSTATIGS